MYEIDSKKRYNVTLVYGKGYDHTVENVKLKVAEPNFIVAIENGKEHIFTGAIGIYLSEI